MRTMLRSHFKLLVIVSGLLLAVAGMALADQLTQDGDALDTNVNGTPVALGDVDPGQTITKQIGFSLKCQGNNHVDRGKSVKLSYTATGSVIPTGGSLTGGGTNATPTDATIGPIPNTWPLDSNNTCPASDTLTSSPNSNVELKAPKASGAKSFTVNYNISELNADGTVYAGDTNNGNFTSINGNNTRSVTYTMNVRNLPPVISSIDGDDPVLVNDQKQYTINASDPNDDALTYTTSVSGPATIVSGNDTATPTLNFTGPGSVVLTAIARDTANNASAPQTKTITVNSATRTTTTSLSSSSTNNTSTYGDDVTFTAEVTASAGNPTTGQGNVTFVDGTTTLCSNVALSAASKATCTTSDLNVAGSPHSITALYSGHSSSSPQFGASTGTLTQTVNKASSDVQVTCTAGAPYTYTGNPITPCTANVTGAGGLNQAVTPVTYDHNTNAGTANASASYAGDDNHDGDTGSANFTINKATPKITWDNPAAVDAGTVLGSTQLNAVVTGVDNNVLAGTSVYSPAANTLLLAGTQNLTVTFTPNDTGNYVSPVTKTVQISVSAYKFGAFYQPVDNRIRNGVKGGSTVPMKFEVFQGLSGTELKSTSAINTWVTSKVNCTSLASTEDAIEEYTTGNTSLRFDTTGDFFILNWQAPKAPVGTCYQVTITANDGAAAANSTVLTALFTIR